MGNCADAVGTAARLPGGATDAEEYRATPAVGRRSAAAVCESRLPSPNKKAKDSNVYMDIIALA